MIRGWVVLLVTFGFVTEGRGASVSSVNACGHNMSIPCVCDGDECAHFVFGATATVDCRGANSCKGAVFTRGSTVSCSGDEACAGTLICSKSEYGDGQRCTGCHDGSIPLPGQKRGVGAANRRCTVDPELYDVNQYFVTESGTVKECVGRTAGCIPAIVNGKCNYCTECKELFFTSWSEPNREQCGMCLGGLATPPVAGIGNWNQRCSLCAPGFYGESASLCTACPEDIQEASVAGLGSFEQRCGKIAGLSMGELWGIIDGTIFIFCVAVLFALRHWYYCPVRQRNHAALQYQAATIPRPENEYETMDMAALHHPSVSPPSQVLAQPPQKLARPIMNPVIEGPYETLMAPPRDTAHPPFHSPSDTNRNYSVL